MTRQGKSFGLSVKAIVRDPENRCLVLRRSRQARVDPGLWDLPGGKCGAGEIVVLPQTL